MRILDEMGQELQNPDLTLGRLTEERLLICSHPAVEGVREVWHYETVREYPNGGKDVERVVDVPGVEAKDAWDEYENIRRYIPYTEEELAAIKAEQSKPDLLADLDAMLIDHELRLTLLELGV